MRASNILLAVVLLVPAASDAQFTIRPGLYEFEVQMELGLPGSAEAQKAVFDAAGFEKQKRRDCITTDQATEKDFMKLIAGEMAEANCKVSDSKTTGNKLTFTTTCVDEGVRMTWATEMTFGPDSFSGVTKGKGPDGREMGLKTNAKRIGECTK